MKNIFNLPPLYNVTIRSLVWANHYLTTQVRAWSHTEAIKFANEHHPVPSGWGQTQTSAELASS